ncbi:MAG: ABC transporter permease, partial [Gammaproteobacteria bacterium]|nr:ABC transporter permease [Gammaproteobacteria bacterium]
MNGLSRVAAIFAKELRQLRRDRMTFGMVVMIPLIQLLLFGFAINTNVRHIPAGVVDLSGGAIGRILQQTAQATGVVSFTGYFDDIATAEMALASSRVRAVLIIPHDVGERLARHPSLGFGRPAS